MCRFNHEDEDDYGNFDDGTYVDDGDDEDEKEEIQLCAGYHPNQCDNNVISSYQQIIITTRITWIKVIAKRHTSYM